MSQIAKGTRFERLIVLNDAGAYEVHCQCDCGASRTVSRSKLRAGHTRSCGCLQADLARKRQFKHGLTETRLHAVWCQMISRCELPTNHAYADYGGRGIYVCARWHDFLLFLEDMGVPPNGHTLDRIDNDGPYSPDNCRWATRQQQARNRRSSAILEFNGTSKTLVEWGEVTGFGWATIRARLTRGWSVSKALTHPVRKMRKTA